MRGGFGVACLAFKIVALRAGSQFLSLFLKATSLIGEPIFERGFVFDPSSRHRHDKLPFIGYRSM
jgi:hypothetical protein